MRCFSNSTCSLDSRRYAALLLRLLPADTRGQVTGFHPTPLNASSFQAFLSIEDDTDQPEESVFYQVQSLFGHLMESKLQYYVPENFWKVTEC